MLLASNPAGVFHGLPVWLVALVSVLAGGPTVATAQLTPSEEAVHARIEAWRATGRLQVGSVTFAGAAVVARVYEQRNFAALWTPDRTRGLLAAIDAVEADGLIPADYLSDEIRRLTSLTSAPVETTADAELLQTEALARLVAHLRFGKVDPSSVERAWNYAAPGVDRPFGELVAGVATSANLRAAMDALAPDHFIYRGLKQVLADLRAIAARGGWPVVPEGPTLRTGDEHARVVALRRRLAAAGYLPAATDLDSPVFDDAVATGVKAFQDHHRLTADGAVGRATIEALNVPVETRVQQVRANLERARWVLAGLDDTFLLVNLPAFKVYYIRDRQLVWEARTQIGREARRTPVFRSDMRYLVFNPTWTVPPTILAQDILPAVRKDQDALRKKGLSVLDRTGRLVDPATIDWATVPARGFPYTLQQPAGLDNALGRVKFMFPNDHAIFLHDTPSRELFGHDRRTFSSGCIRVEHPLDLAARLLDGPDWPAERIEQVVGGGTTQTVVLPRPVPVLIVYWTVSVGVGGQARFARDVYHRDLPLAKALDAPVRAIALPRVASSPG